MARKKLNVFSLSFLDAMTCGFGAVILFFMVINANVSQRSEFELDDLGSEVDRMELRVLSGRKNLVQLKDQLAKLIEDMVVLTGV
ncbi:MAG: VWA domain-containing protein, partial [Gammaproteobacteria bacterium]